MNSPNKSIFNKYIKFGAYHWSVFNRDPRRHDLFTYTRYQVVLDNAAIKDGMSVLDFGCGDGALTYLACKKNPNGTTIGIEPEPVGRGLAKDMLQKKAVTASFLESSRTVPDDSQDVVLCADVIEHVENQDDLISEIHRLLKPNGRIVISTPVRLTEFPLDKEHVLEFFPEEFKQLIEKYFAILNHEYCSSVFATELYSFASRIFFKRPIIGWIMSFVNICFGINLMRKFNPLGQLWMTQTICGIKRI